MTNDDFRSALLRMARVVITLGGFWDREKVDFWLWSSFNIVKKREAVDSVEKAIAADSSQYNFDEVLYALFEAWRRIYEQNVERDASEVRFLVQRSLLHVESKED